MVKTLKLATILLTLLSLAAVGGVVYLTLQQDEQVKKFLNTTGQIDKFIASAKNQQKKDQSPESPLVNQAKAYTNRIDPPPPPTPPTPTNTQNRQPQQTTFQAPPPTAKFTLEGTVVAKDPNNSLAFLNTTSKGLRWYAINEKLGHYTIEEIYQDKIVINDGSGSYEMEVPKRQKISLLKGHPDNPYSGRNTNPYKNYDPQKEMIYQPTNQPGPDFSGSRPRQTTTGRNFQPPPKQLTEEMMKENVEFLQKIANDPESMGISKEEAAELGDMSDLINEMEKEMKQLKKRQPSPPPERRQRGRR